MVGCGVDRLRISRRRPVASAVVGCAEIGAALDHLARDARTGLAKIVTLHLGDTARIIRRTARSARIARVAGGKPVLGPLPDIAGHIEEAIAVGGERANRRAPRKPVQSLVLPRKFALPGIGHPARIRREFVAPAIGRAVQPAARGEFPFRLGRQILAGPGGVGRGVLECDMHDRLALPPHDSAGGAFGMPPVRLRYVFPPVAQIARPHWVGRHAEHGTARSSAAPAARRDRAPGRAVALRM